jgi:hypothetical protein
MNSLVYEPMPPSRSATERFVPYSGYLSQNAGSTSIIKHEAPATSSTHATPVPTLPPHRLNEVAAITVGCLSIEEPQHTLSGMDSHPVKPKMGQEIATATPKQRSLYSWANEYNNECVKSLATTIEERHLRKDERGSIARTLKAAKETILELLTAEEIDKLNLGKIPAQWTRLKKIARQLDVLIPHEFIPKAPGLLAMDRILRAIKSYMYHLRARPLIAGINTTQAISETEPGRILREGLEPDDEAVKAYLKRKKRLRQKERRKKSPRSCPRGRSRSQPVFPSKKRYRILSQKHCSQGRRRSRKRTVFQVRSLLPSHFQIMQRSRNRRDRSSSSETSPPKQDQKSQKIMSKKPTIPDKDEISDIAPVEPKAKKHKKAKISTAPIDDITAIVSPNTTFDLDTSFIGETLEATEHRANRLADEVRNLKAILHAVGVTAGSVSVGLTRMRHGQLAEEIFSGVKRDGHED